MTGDGHFDETVARTYDDTSRTDDVADAVALLSELAAGGRALEFAIGTGRLALPLAAAGVPVSGIELSRAMVDRLRAKPGGAAIEVIVGDMTDEQAPGAFSLVFLAYNTIDNLVTQDAQVACFVNAAAHLAPGGLFLVEVAVPPLQRLPLGETLLAFDRSEGHWGTDEFDLVTQNYVSHHVWIGDNGNRTFSAPFRYAWPAEMDLMARIAGLEPCHRWADWRKAPFTAESRAHVSVWRKPGG